MRRPSLKILLQALEIVADQFFDADQAGAHAIFGNLEDGGFGAIEDDVGIVAGGERLFLNRGGGEDRDCAGRIFL